MSLNMPNLLPELKAGMYDLEVLQLLKQNVKTAFSGYDFSLCADSVSRIFIGFNDDEYILQIDIDYAAGKYYLTACKYAVKTVKKQEISGLFFTDAGISYEEVIYHV